MSDMLPLSEGDAISMKRHISLKATGLLIAAAAALCALGIYRGEHLAVLAKAANLCLECIGLG